MAEIFLSPQERMPLPDKRFQIWSTMQKSALIFISFVALSRPAGLSAQVNMTTWRNDIARTGQNTQETQLTPSVVGGGAFGKLWSYSVDGYVYAQPLYISGVQTASGKRNLLFIATEHDSVYAFDADSNQAIWKASLVDPAHGASAGATSVPYADVGTRDIVPEIGITGTPVIDPATSTLYVVAKSKENGNYLQRLHALDLATGNEKPNSPTAIAGSVPGNGDGASGGQVSFLPRLGLERVGLLLLNGHVYFAMASHGDNGPYHGWVFAYDAATLQQTGIYCTSPSGSENGVWQSGAGLAADTLNGPGRLFFVNGNGTLDAAPPYSNTQSFGDGIGRLDLSGGGLLATDEWSPFDQDALSRADLDQGSGGVLLLPDQPGSHVHELVQVGKNGRIEVLDRDNLGGFNPQANNVAQEIAGQVNGLWSTPAYWNGNVYFWGNGDVLKQFSLGNGRLSSNPVATGKDQSGFPGASPVITSNGTGNAILWAIRSDGYIGNQPAVLEAYDAANVSTLLYTSAKTAADAAGPAVKFTVPTAANGRVYVGAAGEVDVYGQQVTVQTISAPVFSPIPGKYAPGQTVTISSGSTGAAIYYTLDGSQPTAASSLYTGPIALAKTTTLQAIAVAPGSLSSPTVLGTYTISSPATVDFSSGFTSVNGLTLNGSVVHTDDSRIQLTNGGSYQAGSFFWSTPIDVRRFTTDYTFQLSGTMPQADGITFTIQNSSPTALGGSGGGLGYGSYKPGGPVGIPRSLALKFDTYNNAGEGTSSSGVYFNGASPTVPSINLVPHGLQLGSGDIFAVHEVYDGKTLTITLKDTVTGASGTGSFQCNLTQLLGGSTAYVGFTGGTGGLTSSQKVLSWTFTSQP